MQAASESKDKRKDKSDRQLLIAYQEHAKRLLWTEELQLEVRQKLHSHSHTHTPFSPYVAPQHICQLPHAIL